MFKRKVLTLQDIQDNEDRKNRRVRKKRETGRKEIQLSFEDHDEDLVPILSTRVKQVEKKLNSFGKLNGILLDQTSNETLGDASASTQISSSQKAYDSQEDEPQLVVDELTWEDSIKSIQNVEALCLQLIENYEQRGLHRLFDSVEQNCAFRLFLYAVAYGQYAQWTQNNLFLSVLKELLPQQLQEGQSRSKDKKRDALSELGSKKLNELREMNNIPKSHLMRVSISLQVPNRIKQYFNP